ncbi:exonuclease domain protein, partial [Escherichia coli TW09195]
MHKASPVELRTSI